MHNTPSKTASSKSSFYEKAVRYILDSDASSDQSEEEIYLLGLSYDGSRTSTEPEQPQWPAQFYSDFRSRIWCTYRKDFEPIQGGGSQQWTSDTGWGCMIRTGQSLLANSLQTVHVGRDWRRTTSPPRASFFLPTPNSSPKNTHRRKPSIPSPPSLAPTEDTEDHATYVRLLTWFFDSPKAPFSIHRLCLSGQELGTHVGEWFGPSVAAHAIASAVKSYPACGLGVSLAVDGVFYQSSIFEASNPAENDGICSWGARPVLLLLGLRLGLDGVNPIYFSTIKQLLSWPQSAGIAGGRPSSSLYFVGSQGDNLFYLDPHHTRSAIPLRSDTMDPVAQSHATATAYSPTELHSYHCDKVRKMPISSLDPSMLVGFLVQDGQSWTDFRRRVSELPRAIFSVQDEPPAWPTGDLSGDEDDGLALESVTSTSSQDAVNPNSDTSSSNPLSSKDTPSNSKARSSFIMEGLRNKLRSFGRSRTSLSMGEGEPSK
ncbi:Cysteine protease [Mycena indigotica]|uniref:Cysteine protease n=1 Tax=Mycena indigotica TaxID=2126181 RepID=A0A8H6T3D2_9AGAR|nr:Cysteine protease [Mycena indigotica]KAF7309607.1 Cysteine protease [Mycena indigotica]